MQRSPKLFSLSAANAAKGIVRGEFTATELLGACLERIAEREEAVCAWEHLDRASALARARELDRAAVKFPLHGVPIGIKDIIDTEDMPTAYGSPIYAGHRPERDAACVTLLKKAGAIIPGKTVTTEFATFSPGKTRHPRNPAHTPGGSSSGSAAAVADRHVPAGLGTQTAGSIIRPASFCGIIGYKPTYGRFSYDGIKPTALSLDTLGLLVRDFEDLHLIGGVLAGADSNVDWRPADRPPRVGFCRTPWWDRADTEMRSALEETAQRLERSGAPIKDIELPDFFDRTLEAQDVLMSYENSQCLRQEYEHHVEKLSLRLRATIAKGLRCRSSEVQAARCLACLCQEVIARFFLEVDVLLTPSAIGAAPVGLSSTGDPIFNRLWTYLGVPCITYPVARAGNGLPLGVQVIGARDADDPLIRFGSWMYARSGATL
jgi:Asp-tRNA(Asn)/Glu-tRNA(Gln) amidotransferase A subunit family amidase